MDWLYIIGFLVMLFIGIVIGRKIVELQYKAKLQQWIGDAESSIRKDAIERSRVTLGGKMSEQLAPYFPDFKHDPTEVRFIGTPVDFIVFPGLSGSEPKEIVFLEVKTGQSKLTARERKIKELVEQKKIRWEEYRPNR
ncbi:MAG: Holliday junction resolvase-like protein [Candidatus Aenigmatarchaeota archaeon]